MRFKHLFLFPNHHVLRHFYSQLEERLRYSYGGVDNLSRAHRRFSMWTHEGEHEIILGLVEDIEWGRFRGMDFDKISIHETVELTWKIHQFVQYHTLHRFGRFKVKVDDRLRENEMMFVNERYIDRVRREGDHRPYSLRYLMGDWKITPPEFKGIIGDLSV